HAPGGDEQLTAQNGSAAIAAEEAEPLTVEHGGLESDDRVILVIDPSSARAREVVEAVRARGCKAIVARRPTAALGLAREHRPQAVMLAGELARVEMALAQLKKHPDTRHVPVMVVADAMARIDALRAGA